jgi:hypothetical protein
MPFKSVKDEMDKWKAGTLHSGSAKGPIVTKQKQAIAIALSEEARKGKTPGLGHVRHALRTQRMSTLPKGKR